MAVFEFTLRGDQIAQYGSISGNGNGADRIVTLTDVTALGAASDSYTIRIDQAQSGATEFENGQFITITDSFGNVLVSNGLVQPDTEQGLGAGDEHLILSNGFVIDIGGFNPGPESVQYTAADETAQAAYGDNDGQLDFVDTRADFPCFDIGTLIRTPKGNIPIEQLRVGQVLSTVDGGQAPIAWIAGHKVKFADDNDPRKPILFSKGALGKNVPHRDLVLSPQHCLDGRPLGLGPRLIPAKSLTHLPGVRVMHGRRAATYFSIILPRHNLIWANDYSCESTYPGNFVMSVLPAVYRRQIMILFPLLTLGVERGYGPRVLPRLTPQDMRDLRPQLEEI